MGIFKKMQKHIFHSSTQTIDRTLKFRQSHSNLLKACTNTGDQAECTVATTG